MPYDLVRIEAQLEAVEESLGAIERRRSKGTRLGKSDRKLVRARYTKDRGYLLRLGLWDLSKEEAGVSNHTFIVKPQVPFRPRRLVLNEWAGGTQVVGITGNLGAYIVTEIKVGQDSQFVQGNGNSFPASAFTPKSSQVLFKFDSCEIGQSISVSIENVDPDVFTNESVITAGMIGFAADR